MADIDPERHLFTFGVPGVPMPKGSLTPVVRGGRVAMLPGRRKGARLAYAQWCREIVVRALATRDKTPPIPRLTPLGVGLVFYLNRPKSLPKRYLHPVKRPDLDKLVRTVLDCLVAADLLKDDSQIVQLEVQKKFGRNPIYPESPGVIIACWAAD